MYKKGNIKVTVGGPETALGTAVARTNRLPITDYVDVAQTANKNPSEVITGRSTVKANYIDSIDLGMELPMELHCDKGTGLVMVSALGQDLATPVQVGGAMIISYIGEELSCKLVVTANDIKAYKGSLGAEVLDTDFGTSGTYTLSALAADIAALDAEADYTAKKLFGADALVTTAKGHAIASAQASGNSVVIYITSADSGVYLHRFEPVLTNTERPTLSLQVDGTGLLNDVLGGAVVDKISLSADLKGRVSMTASVIGTNVTSAEVTSVALNEKKPMKFSDAQFYLAGLSQTFVRSVSVDIANGHSSDEGFGAGSLYKQDHAKGMFAVNGSITLRSNTATEVEYAKRITEEQSALTFLFTGDTLATDVPEMLLIRIPHAEVNGSKSGGDVSIDTELTFDMVDPESYDAVLTIDMLTKDAVKYN